MSGYYWCKRAEAAEAVVAAQREALREIAEWLPTSHTSKLARAALDAEGVSEPDGLPGSSSDGTGASPGAVPGSLTSPVADFPGRHRGVRMLKIEDSRRFPRQKWSSTGSDATKLSTDSPANGPVCVCTGSVLNGLIDRDSSRCAVHGPSRKTSGGWDADYLRWLEDPEITLGTPLRLEIAARLRQLIADPARH